MKKFGAVFLLLFFAAFAQAQDAGKNAINAASLLSGSYMRQTPPSYTPTNLMSGSIRNYSPEALFDQSEKMWCSKEGSKFPMVFEIEFTEDYIIDELVFNTNCENYPGISAKDVTVSFATSARTPVFEKPESFQLQENVVKTYKIEPREARVIRLVINSNHGFQNFTELAEFEAKGYRKLEEINNIDISGEWNSNWGKAVINQTGTLVEGNYEYNNGKIKYGGINRNQVTYTWIEKKINQEGQTLLFLNREGTRLTGIWCFGSNWKDYGFWILERQKGVPFVQREEKQAEPEKENTVDKETLKQMKDELDKKQKLVLYGVNFQINSSVLMPESKSVLDYVGELLSASPNVKIRIEGHTDNIGSATYNSKLSLERATSVKAYLEERFSIEPNRIVVEGKGFGQPVASNDTEMGRAANRRVEIHQLK